MNIFTMKQKYYRVRCVCDADTDTKRRKMKHEFSEKAEGYKERPRIFPYQ